MHARMNDNEGEQQDQQATSTSDLAAAAPAAAHGSSAASPSLRASAMHNAAAAIAAQELQPSSSPPTPLLLPKRGAASGSSSVDQSGANTPNSLLSPLVVHRSVQGQAARRGGEDEGGHARRSAARVGCTGSPTRVALPPAGSSLLWTGFGHGASMPSSRAVGFQHEDHHRSDSAADLGIDEETRLRLIQEADAADAADSPRRPHSSRAQNLGLRSSGRDNEHTRRRDSEPKEADDADAVAKTSPYSSASGDSTPTERRGGRLLIVANRLPLSMNIKKKPADHEHDAVSQITFSNSSGGLVSALSGCDLESRWIGWPGAEVRRSADRNLVTKKLAALKCVPVFLTQTVYNGFCNNLLWPLFHYIPLPVEAITTADEQFEAYKTANEAFADAVLACYEEGDIVWVHDYHLLLLPHMLRAKHPNIKIGFFFHTPFPSYEIYRMLPARERLLEGVLSSNLIGFHTKDYCRHFQKSCMRILGVKAGHNSLIVGDFTAQLGSFPIGIDPLKFKETLEKPDMEAILEEYKREFKGKKVLLGIDRLDYIKGIQHKLYAFELLLEKHPELRSQLVFVQIAVPSRTDVAEYQKLRSSTHELVGRINGLYGGIGHTPIHYLDQSIAFSRMCALYRLADAMVITSVRDGMNLVAYEYVACQQKNAGVLILSEFAGAAESLGGGPILVNPWSISELCKALHTALTMSASERQHRQDTMYSYVTQNTAQRWARTYIKGLLQVTNTPLEWLKELHPADDEQQQDSAGDKSDSARIEPVNLSAVKRAHQNNATRAVVINLHQSRPSPKDTFVREGSMFNLNNFAKQS